MELQYSEMNDIRFIKLIGKLDSAGYNQVDLKFTSYCSGMNVRVIVDLSEVDFVASIGIRMLTINVKSLSTRGGRMVLLNPTTEVKSILDMTGISPIIPIYMDIESAKAALTV